jgi:hypothetical protein
MHAFRAQSTLAVTCRDGFSDFQDRRIQPLCHLSTFSQSLILREFFCYPPFSPIHYATADFSHFLTDCSPRDTSTRESASLFTAFRATPSIV